MLWMYKLAACLKQIVRAVFLADIHKREMHFRVSWPKRSYPRRGMTKVFERFGNFSFYFERVMKFLVYIFIFETNILSKLPFFVIYYSFKHFSRAKYSIILCKLGSQNMKDSKLSHKLQEFLDWINQIEIVKQQGTVLIHVTTLKTT